MKKIMGIWKWMPMFLLAVVLTVPVTAKKCQASDNTCSVKVSKGYLALRKAKAYDSSNEIGKLYTDDLVEVSDYSDSVYWYVYSPKHKKYGYVNKNYLVGGGCTRSSDSDIKAVKVKKGYLALRTARAYDEKNEIGELYSGDVVRLIDTSDADYWYVYSPKYDKNGYVNKDYLVDRSTSSDNMETVNVTKGYLALRTAKAYDSSNEIGELYTGDEVEILDTSDETYWYVFSVKHDKYGYVNKEYLVGGSIEALSEK